MGRVLILVGLIRGRFVWVVSILVKSLLGRCLGGFLLVLYLFTLLLFFLGVCDGFVSLCGGDGGCGWVCSVV
jgi:hypothetical protein